MRIVFMGTPDFAAFILRYLIENNTNILAVVTVPDKPVGRGLKMGESSVKKYAKAQGLVVLQPTNLKDEHFLMDLRQLHADLFVVVAFRMLPEQVWKMPPKGTINLHASLLPNYRGAAPIHWAIINGEQQTGVTTFFIEKEIDTGRIIERFPIAITENETVGELHDRLMQLGAQATWSTIQKIKSGKVNAISQETLPMGTSKNAPKLFKDDCKINFHRPVKDVHNFIRGLSPHPGAWFVLQHPQHGNKTCKVFISQITDLHSTINSPITTHPNGILIPCQDAYLLIRELQMEGKRRMHAKELLIGHAWIPKCTIE